MSELGKCEVSDAVVSSFNAHVFTCPYCKNHTSLLSPRIFISFEKAECENCGQVFLIENDAAHVLQFVSMGND